MNKNTLARKKMMKEILLVFAFLAGWILLNRFVLPKLGIPT